MQNSNFGVISSGLILTMALTTFSGKAQAQTVSTTNNTSTDIAAMLVQIDLLLKQVELLKKQLEAKNSALNELTSIVVEGTNSEDIKLIQQLLATNPKIYPEGEITGYFGPLTKKAITRFQMLHSIPSTGLVDTETKEILREYLKLRINGTIPSNLLATPDINLKIRIQIDIKKIQDSIILLKLQANRLPYDSRRLTEFRISTFEESLSIIKTDFDKNNLKGASFTAFIMRESIEGQVKDVQIAIFRNQELFGAKSGGSKEVAETLLKEAEDNLDKLKDALKINKTSDIYNSIKLIETESEQLLKQAKIDFGLEKYYLTIGAATKINSLIRLNIIKFTNKQTTSNTVTNTDDGSLISYSLIQTQLRIKATEELIKSANAVNLSDFNVLFVAEYKSHLKKASELLDSAKKYLDENDIAKAYTEAEEAYSEANNASQMLKG